MIAHKLRCLYFQTTRRMTTSSSAFLSVESILEQVKANQISISQATALLSAATKTSDDDIQSFANLDYTRAQRTGFPEAVFFSRENSFTNCFDTRQYGGTSTKPN